MQTKAMNSNKALIIFFCSLLLMDHPWPGISDQIGLQSFISVLYDA